MAAVTSRQQLKPAKNPFETQGNPTLPPATKPCRSGALNGLRQTGVESLSPRAVAKLTAFSAEYSL